MHMYDGFEVKKLSLVHILKYKGNEASDNFFVPVEQSIINCINRWTLKKEPSSTNKYSSMYHCLVVVFK
jgi:hypothetical protein